MKLLINREQRETEQGRRYRLHYKVELDDEERVLLQRYGLPGDVYSGLLADEPEELVELAESGTSSHETDSVIKLRRLEENIKRGCLEIIAYWAVREKQEPYEGSEILDFSLDEMRMQLDRDVQEVPALGFQQLRQLIGKNND